LDNRLVNPNKKVKPFIRKYLQGEVLGFNTPNRGFVVKKGSNYLKALKMIIVFQTLTKTTL
jgi:hypothetical protein